MILAWAGLVVAVVLVAVVLALPASGPAAATWPEDAPLNLHDDRGRDPHVRHLARILASDATTEAQRIVGDLAEGALHSTAITLFEGTESARARLGPQVERFVSEPPARDHDEFLRRLADALDRIERL